MGERASPGDRVRELERLAGLQLSLASTLSPTVVLERTLDGVLGTLGQLRGAAWLARPDGAPEWVDVRGAAPAELPVVRALGPASAPLGGIALAEPPGAQDERRLEPILRFAAVALANARAHAAALALRRDPLTGLQQAGHFREVMDAEIARARRHERSLAVLLIDVDRLKRVNDTAGHPAGDRALGRLARALASRARASDLVARLGGDEFAALLPETNAAGARAFARALRSVLRDGSVGVAREDAVSASVGIAVYPADGADTGALIEAADRALYRAKRGGRGRISCAGGRPRAAPPGQGSL